MHNWYIQIVKTPCYEQTFCQNFWLHAKHASSYDNALYWNVFAPTASIMWHRREWKKARVAQLLAFITSTASEATSVVSYSWVYMECSQHSFWCCLWRCKLCKTSIEAKLLVVSELQGRRLMQKDMVQPNLPYCMAVSASYKKVSACKDILTTHWCMDSFPKDKLSCRVKRERLWMSEDLCLAGFLHGKQTSSRDNSFEQTFFFFPLCSTCSFTTLIFSKCWVGQNSCDTGFTDRTSTWKGGRRSRSCVQTSASLMVGRHVNIRNFRANVHSTCRSPNEPRAHAKLLELVSETKKRWQKALLLEYEVWTMCHS